MKKLFLAVVAMMVSATTFAQNEVGQLTIQPKVGVNIANITDADDADPRIGLAAGAEFEYGLTDNIGLSAGVLYSMQGVKTTIIDDDCTWKLDFLNVPILANFYVAKGFAVKLGVQPGFKLSSKAKFKGSGGSKEVEVEDGVKSVDLSIPVGLSYQYQNIVFDARYNWGVTKIVDDVDSKHSVFQITVGYKFSL
ncbi:PorT family protein [Prevotella brevis]|uniref:PorT family protein n=1 Tax=Xylanibacter brevis TaxID=83231 RepID=A0ABS9CI00_9BACT|nr:porin family protein [Xylanibacter brevis]MCF2564631.1 PorT family protein [Xylanibacter brevis]